MNKFDEIVINQYLADYLNDLWLERRLAVEQILISLHSKQEEAGNCVGLKDTIADWIRFLEFLESDCSGKYFDNDKQWSELLNLMQISRKLNQRSVKLKDILNNRIIIEANAKNIKLLNKSAKILQTIESSLNELDKLIENCKLELPIDLQNDEELFSSKRLPFISTYLKERCLSILYILKVEISDDSNIKRDPRVTEWQGKLEKQEIFLIKLVDFIDSLIKMHMKMQQLTALIGTKQLESSSKSGQLTNKMASFIKECGRKFNQVYQFYQKLLSSLYKYTDKKIKASPTVYLNKLYNAKKEELVEEMYSKGLKQAHEDLDRCHRDLNSIMQTLRLEFGRFYFINDAELLTIIALDLDLIVSSKNRNENDRLIGKIFNNSISSFVLDSEKKNVIGVKSLLGEVISFSKEDVVVLRKRLNIYSIEIVRVLNEILRKLSKTIKEMTLNNINTETENIDLTLPIQVINVTEYIRFVVKVETFLKSNGNLNEMIKFYENRFTNFSSLEVDVELEIKKSAIISLIVNFISILVELKENKVNNIDNWHWRKQIRYYLDDNSQQDAPEVKVCIGDSQFSYKFHYLPVETNELASSDNKSKSYKRLIKTSINQRCFMLCSFANFNLKLGSNPYGPAGSGKTETVKALGQLLGCQVIVHNCDETNDADSLDKLIWGLAHTGLWGCLDEFNRLKLSVMSNVSATLELVQSSLRENKSTVENSNQLMRVDPTSAFFVTLNPAGSGGKSYGGRRRLPANIRNLFVPISMTRVEVAPIVSENLMALSGDSMISLKLGNKMEEFLKQMRLSLIGASNRCEWDLRLVMAILRRVYLDKNNSLDLEGSLVSCIKKEIFPRLEEGKEIDAYEACLKNNFETNLDSLDDFQVNQTDSILIKANESLKMNKYALHLLDQLKVRSGVILLGQTKSGKSSCWRLLAECLKDSIKWFALNPRACNKSEFFGFVDTKSQKWIDGLFTKLVRDGMQLLQDSSKLNQIWLVLDGPIEPDWIECINSVLDDNQVLTLSSGERIAFTLASGKSIKLIFETNSLEFASPATISRLALINFSNTNNNNSNKYDNLEETQDLDQLMEAEASIVEKNSSIDFFQKLHSKQRNTLYYNCNTLTNCENLLQLLRSFGQSENTIVFDNIDLIKCDQWHVNSFAELLTYVLTYKLYYDPELLVPIPVKQLKFILITDLQRNRTIKHHRLFNQMKIVYTLNKTEILDLIPRVIEIKNLNDILDNTDDNIITITSKISGLKRREKIKDFCKDSHIIYEFSNTTNCFKSLESLEESSTLGSNKLASKKRKLFLINQIELSFLSDDTRRKMLHNLSIIKMRSNKQVNFIYFTNDLKNNDHLEFWQKMGPVFELIDSDMNLYNILEENLLKEISKDEAQWIGKIGKQFLVEEKIDLNDQHRIACFRRTFCNFFCQSKSSLIKEKRNIESSLKQLEDFEKNVELIKSKCNEEDILLENQKKSIKELMVEIDISLIESKKQKIQIESLKKEQQVKSKVLADKNKLIQSELSHVKPLVEQSKAQISQHLKPEALNEIKTLRSPPKVIKDILDVLFVLLKVDDLSWSSMKTYLTKHSLRDELPKYNLEKSLAGQEGAELLVRVEAEIKQKGDSFNKQQATRASKAIVPILSWIETTLAYGKALVKLAPLTSEQSRLEKERVEVAKQQKEVELAAQQVDIKLKDCNKTLKQLEVKYEKSREDSDRVREQLFKAQKVRQDLNDQMKRWIERAKTIEILLDTSESGLLKLCLLASSISVFSDVNLSVLVKRRSKIFEVSGERQDTLLNELNLVLNLATSREAGTGILYKSEETNRVLQLLCLNLYQNFSDGDLVTFLNIGENRVSKEELVSYLSLKSIISDKHANVSILNWSEFDQQLQKSLELSIKLNKMIILQADNNQMDLVNFVKNKMQTYKQILIVGDINKYSALKGQVNCIDYLVSYETMPLEDLQSIIINHWIRLKNPKLNETIQQLELDLNTKETKIKTLEGSLLRKLAGNRMINEKNASLDEEIVGILSELELATGILREDLSLLRKKMVDLERERNEYANFAFEAAKFYKQNLAHLNRIDKFYHVSVENYISLLRKATNKLEATDFKLISQQVELPMRLVERERFRERMSMEISGYDKCNQLARRLNDVIEDLLNDKLENNKKQDGKEDKEDEEGRVKLMIVLHDATKSSPQLEVNEFFQLKQKLSSKLSYSKVYATGNSGGRLEVELEELRESLVNLKERNVTEDEKIEEVATKSCLCVANAHLATKWINSFLLQKLSHLATATTTTNRQVLIILIAEANDDCANGESCSFSPDILDFASVRYWYDEVGANFKTRYATMLQRVNYSMTTRMSDEIKELLEDMILLHLVCQEKTKQFKGSDELLTSWSFLGYNFDYDLFSIAFKVLLKLVETINSGSKLQSIRENFAYFLESVLYSSRMETLEDEKTLCNLVKRFIRKGEFVGQRQSLLERFLS